MTRSFFHSITFFAAARSVEFFLRFFPLQISFCLNVAIFFTQTFVISATTDVSYEVVSSIVFKENNNDEYNNVFKINNDNEPKTSMNDESNNAFKENNNDESNNVFKTNIEDQSNNVFKGNNNDESNNVFKAVLGNDSNDVLSKMIRSINDATRGSNEKKSNFAKFDKPVILHKVKTKV